MGRRLLEAGSGSRTEAFGAQEWLLLASIALIWGSSFLFIDVGLESFRPGVVALAGVALGVSARALFPAARPPVDRQDLPRVAFLGVIWAGLPLVLFPLAQQWIDSSVAGMLNGAVPLFGAACSAAPRPSGCWSASPAWWRSPGRRCRAPAPPPSAPPWCCSR